jgi:3-dehydroquinate synthase
MRRLTVHAVSRSYPILVGRGVLEELGAAVRKLHGEGQIVVLCDENVAPLYLDRARRSLVAAGLTTSQVILPAGEREKNLARAEELYGVLYDRGLRRSDTLVALGGGVIGDLTGFVAATYQRGVGFVQVPTTLLAQVDASVGGKVAVDFRAGKNYVGTFYQPSLVLADLSTLDTLPARELRCGAAEVAKHGLLAGSAVLRRVRQLARALLEAAAVTQELVVGSIQYKAGVVERDERESGLRAVLNFGHTAGHALEAITKYKRFRHGEAVGYGMLVAAEVGVGRGRLAASDRDELAALIRRLGPLPSIADLAIADMVEAMRRDKKVVEGRLHYVLATAIGEHAVVDDVSERELSDALTRVGFC